jgi:hypothetical protein
VLLTATTEGKKAMAVTTEREWILWGAHPRMAGGTMIRLTGGTLAECRRELEWRRDVHGGWLRLEIRPNR